MPVDVNRIVTELVPGENPDGLSEPTIERIVRIVLQRLEERERVRAMERTEAEIRLEMRPLDPLD
jgi:hypothetical protein